MEYVEAFINSVDTAQITSTTGVTRNIGGVLTKYLIGSQYERLHQIHGKTLARHRKAAEERIPVQELTKYFILSDGSYYYSQAFGKLRVYKRELANTDQESKTEEINASTFQFSNEILSVLKKHRWKYAGGVNYSNRHEVSRAVAKMREVHKQLCLRFPTASISLYFTTEYNDPLKKDQDKGFHSHLAINVDGTGLKHIRRDIQRILQRCGTTVPFLKRFDEEQDWISYISKQVFWVPDGWGILSNDHQLLSAIKVASIR